MKATRIETEELERVVPWDALVQIVEPHCPTGEDGRPPFALQTLLRMTPSAAVRPSDPIATCVKAFSVLS